MEQKIQISFPLATVKAALTEAIDMRLDELIGQCGSMDVDQIAKECININAQTVVEQYDFAAMVSSKISREIAAIDFENFLVVQSEGYMESFAADSCQAIRDSRQAALDKIDQADTDIEEHIKKAVAQAVDEDEALKENLEHWTSQTLWDVIDGHVVNQDIPALIRAEAAKHISRATDQPAPSMAAFVIELSNLLADRDDYDAVLKPQLVKLLEVVCAR